MQPKSSYSVRLTHSWGSPKPKEVAALVSVVESRSSVTFDNVRIPYGCRSLEVFEQHGVTHSELLKAQRTAGGSGLGGPLRHPNSIILWLRCDRVSGTARVFISRLIGQWPSSFAPPWNLSKTKERREGRTLAVRSQGCVCPRTEASAPRFITLRYLINDKVYRAAVKLAGAVNTRLVQDNSSIEISFITRLDDRRARKTADGHRSRLEYSSDRESF